MSLADLANKLRTQAASGFITITSRNLTEGTGLTLPTGLDLDKLLIDSFKLALGVSLQINVKPSDIPSPSGNTLVIKNGKSNFPNLNLQNIGIEIKFTTTTEGSNTILNFTLITLLGNWKFQDSFKFMRGDPYNFLPFSNPQFVFSTSEVASFIWNDKTISLAQGQNFVSNLTVTDILQVVLNFITGFDPSTVLPFYGPINVKDANTLPTLLPEIWATASLSATPISVLALSLSNPTIGLRVAKSRREQQDGTIKIVQFSTLYFGLKLTINTTPAIELNLFIPISSQSPIYTLMLSAPTSKPLTPDTLFALVGGEQWTALIPAQLQQFLNAITFKDLAVEFVINNNKPKVIAVQVAAGSTGEWHLFDQFTIREFDAIWMIENPGADSSNSIIFTTSFEFFPELFKGEFDVTITSDLLVIGEFDGMVKFSDIVSVITHGAIQVPQSQTFLDFGFTQFNVTLDLRQKSYSLAATAFASLDILGTRIIELHGVNFLLRSLPQVGNSNRQFLGSIDGTLLFGESQFGIYLSAEYQGSEQGWHFMGSMLPGETLALGDLINRLFEAAKLPSFLPGGTLAVSDIVITASPASGQKRSSEYTGQGKLQLVNTQLGALGQFSLVAQIEISYQNDGTTSITQGSFSFTALIEAIGVEFIIGYKFNTAGSNVLFLRWEGFLAEYDTTRSEIRFSIDQWSFGDMITAFVKLVTGDSDFRLPSPWDLLNEISLRSLVVIFNLNTKQVTLNYTLTTPIELAFLTINGFSISKDANGVLLALNATFIDGSTVPPFKPNEGTPDIPGGNSLLDLKLLALGQHITVEGINQVTNMNDAIMKLASFNNNPSNKLPIGGANQPSFDPNNSWLIGLHVLALGDTIDLKIVFLDPELYGLRIALAGEKAKIFAGLQFEILYKRINDTIGVYQIELKLPDAMRYLDFGQLSIILPVVGIEIFTNGNFKVDFGFPYNNDFSRSFGIQYFPFTGAGGFYFASLSQETSKQLPQTTLGRFDPVYEFGIGFQVGLGKTINQGPLTAGVSITVFGILEGVIAAWRPNQPSTLALPSTVLGASPNGQVETDYYYRFQGTLGIIGQIYGSIDFSIIQATLRITVIIFIQATIEAYRPLLIYLEASVNVALEVTIDFGLFTITFSLSFSAKITEQFQLGQTQQAPWDSPQLMQRVSTPLSLAQVNRHIAALNFSALAVDEEDKPEIHLYFAPHLTVAGDPDAAPTASAAKFVAMFYIDAPAPGGTQPTGSEKTSFERFAEEVFVWAVHAFWDRRTPDTPTSRVSFANEPVTRDHIAAAFKFLSDNSNARPISYERDIVPGLFSQLRFVIHPPSALSAASAFPMIPNLRLLAPSYKGSAIVDVKFDSYNLVNDQYMTGLRDYFRRMMAQYQSDIEKKYAGVPSQNSTSLAADDEPSFSTVIFEDTVLMMARHMLQAALDALNNFSFAYNGEKISAIVGSINSIGTTTDAVNNLTAEAVAFTNRALALAANQTLTITGIRYQIQNNQSLGEIAATFKVTDASTIISDNRNNQIEGLLREGVTLDLNGVPYIVQARDTFASIIQNAPTTYPTLAATLLNRSDALVALGVLTIPSASYTTQDGDTLQSLSNLFNVSFTTLSSDVADNINLFKMNATPAVTYLDLPNLNVMTVDDLLADMASKHSISHLSGMAARFLLYGLRPPVNSNIQINPASACAGKQNDEPCAIYDLTGQQFNIPALTIEDADKWAITLQSDEPLDWLEFVNSVPGATNIRWLVGREMIDWLNAVLPAARSNGMQADIASITQLQTYRDDPRRFNLLMNIPIQSATPLNYPVNNSANQFVPSPRLWMLPQALLTQLELTKEARPKLSPRISNRTEVTQTTEARTYGWATTVEVQVKRLRVSAESESTFTNAYEFIGADEAGITLMERLLDQAGQGQSVSINRIYIFYRPNVTGQQPVGLQSDGMDRLTAFLIKANLSTDTNPIQALTQALALAAKPTTGILNDPLDFIRLAWEASITRSGGFYFYFMLADGGTGLPDYLFNQSPTGTITLLIVHDQPDNLVGSYVNSLLVGDNISDPTETALFAQSEQQNVIYTTHGNESLADIESAYNVRLSNLADSARNLQLQSGNQSIQVREIYHQVIAPNKTNPNAETLAQIATHFSKTEAEIRAANPGVNFNPLAFWTLLRIPDVTLALTPNNQLNTLGKIADFYGVSIASLAWANAKTQGIFAAGQSLNFTDQILDRTGTLPPGNVGFQVVRNNPGAGRNPNIYLQSQFNLLEFRVAENTAFNKSSEGLPVTSATTEDTQERQQTRRPPKAANAIDPWVYDQVLNIASSAKQQSLTATDGDRNPYSGVGSLAQVHFNWQDLFGNQIASPLTNPVLGPAQPINDVPLHVAYTDALLGIGLWPSLLIDYLFDKEGTSNKLYINIKFDISRYEKTEPPVITNDPNELPAWQQHTLADLQTYKTIFHQINQLGANLQPTTTFTLTTSMDNNTPHLIEGDNLAALYSLVDATIDFLGQWIDSDIAPQPPAERRLEIEVQNSNSNPADIFELSVALELSRPINQVDVAFRDDQQVARSLTLFNPQLDKVEGDAAEQTVGLTAFAQKLESAYNTSDIFLKVATGQSRDDANTRQIWIVRFRKKPALSQADHGIYFKINDTGIYYAPVPLSNTLVSRSDIPLHPYIPETGVDFDTTNATTFTAIDLDVWGRQTLAAIDLFLSPQFAIPAFMVDYLDPEENGFLQKILDVKRDLAGSISKTINTVLTDPPIDPHENPQNFADAQEKMRQQTLARLENAYNVTVITQFDVEVHSQYVTYSEQTPELQAPRFYGFPVQSQDPSRLPQDEQQNNAYVFSMAKPPLTNGVSYLSSAFSATDVERQSSFKLDLDFKITNIEHEISAVNGIEGYTASSWLSFVIPLVPDPSSTNGPTVDSRIGKANIPVPLRAFPSPPSLLGQSGVAAHSSDSNPKTTVEKAKLWDYAYVYSKPPIAQDTIDAEVEFNISDATGLTALGLRELDLFDYLGIFISVYPDLQRAMIDQLSVFTLDIDPTSDEYIKTRKILSDFYTLIKQLPAAWIDWHNTHASTSGLSALGALSSSHYGFSIQEESDQDTGRLLLTRTIGDDNDALVYNPQTEKFEPLPPPQIVIINQDTTYTMTPGPEPNTFFFIDKSGRFFLWEDAVRMRERNVVFKGLNSDGLNVMAYQNASSAVQIFRNRDLVRGTDGKVIPTNKQFIYSTGQIRFADRLTPLLMVSSRINIADITSQHDRTLADHLIHLFNAIFEGVPVGTSQEIKIECNYFSTLDDNPLLPLFAIPVFLRTPFTYTVPQKGSEEFVRSMADLIQEWFNENDVKGRVGHFRFDFTVFPSLTNSHLPLLNMSNLVLEHGNITDLTQP